MEKSGSVCFFRHPRTISDLMQPHLFEKEQEYQIVKTIKLQILPLHGIPLRKCLTA